MADLRSHTGRFSMSARSSSPDAQFIAAIPSRPRAATIYRQIRLICRLIKHGTSLFSRAIPS